MSVSEFPPRLPSGFGGAQPIAPFSIAYEVSAATSIFST
jgi:hypothetical protein